MKKTMTLLAAGLLMFGADSMMAQSTCSKKADKECSRKCDGEKSKTTATEIEFAVITRAQLVDILTAGSAIVFDARGQESYDQGHIDGAISYAGATLPEDKGAAIVFYCGGPKCAAAPKAARSAIEQGYTNVMVFTGGWLEWSEGSSGDQAGL